MSNQKTNRRGSSLYKTTIAIWTRWDPRHAEIDGLAEEAMQGDAYCSRQTTELIAEPELDEYPPPMEFFFVEQDEDGNWIGDEDDEDEEVEGDDD